MDMQHNQIMCFLYLLILVKQAISTPLPGETIFWTM